MIKIKLNNQQIITVNEEKNGINIDGELLNLNISKLSSSTFHVLLKNKSYRVEVVEKDQKNNKLILSVNGKSISVEGRTELDQLLEKMGIADQKTKRVTDIKAPMPGLILNIFTKEGQAVKKGDSLIILEAMKMENILKASEDGVIKRILVKSGEAVEKNQILLEFK